MSGVRDVERTDAGEEFKRRLAAAELRMEHAEGRLRDLAQRLGVPDGGRYLNDWYSRIDHLRKLEDAE